MKIGIVKEGKTPIDHRVPFTPQQCQEMMEQFQVDLVVQPSSIRCYTDQEYQAHGITLQQDLSDCDVLFGVKEVNIDELMPEKQYFFFSHTIKMQPYNQNLLKAVIAKNITLTDYECLTNQKGFRVVAFGRFAGIVGAYNALWAYGIKHQTFKLKRAFECKDLLELFAQLDAIKVQGLKVALTGGGRVAKGAMEVLEAAGFEKAKEEDFELYTDNCYLQLDAYEYNERKDGEAFSFEDFYANPTQYTGTFRRIITKADVLIAGAYWDPKAPVLFDLEDLTHPSFRLDVISDITCDIQGSVPTTLRSTTIADPVYDISKSTLKETEPFSDLDHVTVVAVDNLPCELPRDASESFGRQLLDHVIPVLVGEKKSEIIRAASIAAKGQLTTKYSYLTDYISK